MKTYTILSILLSALSVRWQGTGNISQSNWTFIWSTVEANIASYAPDNLPGFSTKISDALNDAWAPTWNVFVMRLYDPSIDAVVYGYAFKNHWMWLNSYSYEGNYYSFVLWKDYHCKTWNTISDSMRQTSFATSMPNYNIISNFIRFSSSVLNQGFYPYSDIWQTIEYFGKNMIVADPSSAFTIVGLQNGFSSSTLNSEVNGHFCSAGGAESYLFIRVSSMKT